MSAANEVISALGNDVAEVASGCEAVYWEVKL
jgi:hypothetical protein